jgi:hypothetical protein
MRMPKDVVKYWRHPSENWVAVGCGAFTEVQGFFSWLAEERANPPPELKDSCVYVAYLDGKVHEYSSYGKLVLDQPYIAEGAASEFCHGAMAAGATAVEAVILARDLTEGAFGSVVEIDLEDMSVVKH